MGVTWAPAASNRRAAACTAAVISGSTGRPQPASSSRPMRRPLRCSGGVAATPAQSSACAGRLMLSRASGWLSTCNISAASLTPRVMGPAARPM